MNIIRKYIFKCISEKKLRTALIILSIAISSSLYFASSSISDTMVKVQTDRWRANLGYTDIMVQGWWESPSRYFSREAIKDMENNFEYAVGSASGYGIYKYGNNQKQGVNLLGVDFDELNKITKIDLLQGSSVELFGGKKIIISSVTSKKYKLQLGESITLDINGVKYKFLICAIAFTQGPFIGEGDAFCGVIPLDTLASLYNVRGKIDKLYIKLKNSANKHQAMKILNNKYKRYNVKEPFSEKEIRSQNNKVKIPFLALTIILSFMSVYIINSTFKLIALERLPVIGTFRSIGAERKTTSKMLFMESLLYGVIGGALGCFLGVGVLYLMSIFTMPVGDLGYVAAITFKPIQLLYTFLISVVLCLVSSIIPILRTSRMPIKDVIFNKTESITTKRFYRGIVGFIFIGFGIVAPLLKKGKYGVYINAFCIMGIIAGVAMIIPYLTSAFIKIFSRFYSLIFKNEGIIAVKNLRGNSSSDGSISLLAIGISCLLFVNTLSYSTLSEISNYYDRNNYEIYMVVANADKELLQAVKATEGVKSVTRVMGLGGIELINKGDIIGFTQGIDTEVYLNYNNIQLPGDRQGILDMLNKGRGILITNTLKNRFDLKLGDELKLRAFGKQTSYRVIGFLESIENNGSYALVSNKYMKLDMGWSDNYYSSLFIKTTENPDIVLKNLKARFANQQPFIKTMRELKKENMHYNKQIFLIAKGFSIMTMIAGILGIFNNLIINFIQRKRYLAMYRSIGMSRVQIVKMIFIEALTIGLIGSVVGTLAGMLMIYSGGGLLRSLEMISNIHYSSFELIMCLLFGIIITILASIVPALKASKLNLMEAIKYE